MQKVVCLAICAVALGLGVNVASADVLTLVVTGHVGSVSDSSLGITVNQGVTATYSYDTSTLPSSTGVYQPASPPANITVAVAGGPTYQSQNNWTFQITVSDPGFPMFGYTATSPSSSSGGATTLLVGYYDPQSQWLIPPALPTTAPPFNGSILVNPPNSSGFTVQMDSVTLAPSITVSPSNSSFIAQQNFDAVLLLSAQLSVSSLQASVGGTSIGFSYPGTCQLAAANGAQRTALICPNAAAVLAGLGGGPVTINWLITFADGSTAQQSVIWNLVL